MNVKTTLLATLMVATAGIGGCKPRNEPAVTKQADKLDQRADKVEQKGTDKAKSTADTMRAKADVLREGTLYEVSKVDLQGQNVTLRMVEPKAKMPEGEKSMQAGHDLNLTFTDLEKYDLDQHKTAAGIASTLREGDKVTVFMDTFGSITKITY